ncbi:MAG: FG-GAP-like repeat-containing protein [Opitutaceae bacterium]
MAPPEIAPFPVTRSPAGLLVRGALLASWILMGAHAASGLPPAQEGGISSRPLAPHPYPRGRTMFTRLSPEETGVRVENSYGDPRMWGELYHEFADGPIGTGVAIGDFDGDGLPDLFVVSKTEGCRLFRNLGGYRFQDVTAKAGVGATPGVWNEGATFVDINNDGLLDIYVCRFNAPNLLYVNQGDGTFKEMAHAYGLDVVDACGMAYFCDYDRDGGLDVFIQTNLLDYNLHPNGQRNYLFHNNRDGTFTNVTERAGISGEAHGHSAAWWDLEGEGWPDLYVANDFAAPDVLYHNNRDGTFTNVIDRVVPHMPYSSMGSDVGDLLNDGHIDLLVADMAATTHEEDQRSMADSRSRTTEDDQNPGLAPQYERSALYLSTCTGRCLEAAFLAGIEATDWTWSPRFEDLDNDGRLDLFVTNGMYREAHNVDLLARQAAADTPNERLRIMRSSPVFAETHLAFRNLGDLRFENTGAAWGLDEKGVAFGAAFGDLSGDGNLDIVYTNYQGNVTILRNDNDSGQSVDVSLRGTVSNRFGIGATVRVESALGVQARPLLLGRGYMSSSEPMVHFGLGRDTLITRMTVRWPSGHVQTFENLPAGRRYTVTEPPGPVPPATPPAPHPAQFEEVSRSAGLSLPSREEAVDETAVQRLLPLRLNRRGPALAVGDIAGHGEDDIAVGATTLDSARIVLRTASGAYAAAAAAGEPPPVDNGPLLLFDAAGTGREDLLVTGGGNALPAGSPEYQPHLFLNDGRGGLVPAPPGTLPPLPISAGAVAAADFLHSGRLGLFIGGRVVNGQYPLPPRSALLANRGGRFEDVTDALAPGLREVGMVTSALWTDVDGDGWPDLVLTLEWGNVKYFHNNQGRGFDDWTERSGFASAGTGWWTSIAAADFNGDGRPDYVVGNTGLNSPYRASPERPALLFYGDFTGEGAEPQLVEAYYEGDRLYPWRTRKDLGAVIPALFRRFPKNNIYAHATLEQIVGADKLAAAQRFVATELRSGVLLSQPDGTFRFEPLPRIAQISPFQGLATGDFDGDGNADIYAVQNSYAPIPSVGRMNGGLSQLLLGDGRGHFRPVPPAESGLVVPGDAKALVVLDVARDGWPGFLVSRNNDTTLAFRNHGVAGRHPLCVRLQGPPGNPTGVGARVTLELADGTTRTAEIYAGCSDYSQSPAACFFGYADSNPPLRITVRWPSGVSTAHTVAPGCTTLTLPSPRSP